MSDRVCLICGVPVHRQNYCDTCDELYNDGYTDYTEIKEIKGDDDDAMEN